MEENEEGRERARKICEKRKTISAICAQEESGLMPFFDLTLLLHRDRKGKSKPADRQRCKTPRGAAT